MANTASSQETADKLNKSLPIHILPSDVEKNPEFAKLLVSISRHVTENGTSTATNRDLDEARDGLKQVKLNYLQLGALYDELKEMILEYNMKKQEVSPSSTTTELYDALEDLVTSAEAIDYLELPPGKTGTRATLLGLQPENLMKSDKQLRSLQQSFQQVVIPELELRLKIKCEEAASFHEPKHREESEGLTFARARQLPAILQREKQLLDEQKRLLQYDRTIRDKKFRQYYQALLRSLQILEQLITNHRLQSQHQCDRVTAEWLGSKCDAMCLKIKVLENQLIRDTYTPETVAALRKIKDYLEIAEEESSTELQSSKQALKAYESVGMGFDALVQQYTRLTAEIDNKKWALSELRQTQDNDMNDLWKD